MPRDRSKRTVRQDDRPRVRRPDRLRLLPAFDDAGGLRPGATAEVSAATGVPEAHAYGTASFFHLLERPDVEARVCDGTPCRMRGADALLAGLRARGVRAEPCACLAQCDQAPAVLLGEGGHYRPYRGVLPVPPTLALRPLAGWLRPGEAGDVLPDDPALPINLAGDEDAATAFAGWDAVVPQGDAGRQALFAALEASGLRGRGGAGFPAHLKWRAVEKHRGRQDARPVVVCNADEGEPGTFKDRAIALLRPMLLLEGLALGAWAVGAEEIVIYLRGEQGGALASLQQAIAALRGAGRLDGLVVEIALGHGAYICGEETALLEALEGRRGMPRHKPPFPTDSGYLGRPTLLSNVETFASVPAIVRRGGDWYAGLGARDADGKPIAAGMRLYSVSGDVARPGVYELPCGSTLRTLIATAGGMAGEAPLQAFIPGGAASGVLPARHQDVPLDAGPLGALGSMAGSAGVVVLDGSRDVAELVADSLRFFRDESCGQCAPCRVGTQVLAKAFEDYRRAGKTAAARQALERVAEEIGWEMGEGSICGLGQAAHFPLGHYLRDFAS
ncbi:MAG: SLBB domain-containing protein [Deltaproteobacteria bacterium]|nr:SLBB domain-containing protein [Deltaproteobacteria bacterium]